MIANLNLNDCISLTGEFEIIEYYKDTKHRCLYILGKGFDPRMCEGLKVFQNIALNLDICLLEYKENVRSSSKKYIQNINENAKTLLGFNFSVKNVEIKPPLSKLPIFLKNNFTLEYLQNYERIIVDISSMPQNISFNLIKHMLNIFQDKFKIDIIICENGILEDSIIPVGLAETATFLNGFNRFSIDMESEENSIPIWFPLLGLNCRDELIKIHEYISPKEICPVLPFPSQNPKRSDEIIEYLGELLFTRFSIDKRSLLYVAENKIVDIYRKLCDTIYYYNNALKIIGNPKFIFSLESSKLIGLGALLASLDISSQNINSSFAFVEHDGYNFNSDKYDESKNILHCLCLTDNVYEW
jgi:hypothetical protein